MSTDFFFGGDTNGPQPRSLNQFSCKTCQMTWFRTRMCLFGIRKQKFNIQKPPFWGQILTGQYFWLKRIINLNILITQLY